MGYGGRGKRNGFHAKGDPSKKKRRVPFHPRCKYLVTQLGCPHGCQRGRILCHKWQRTGECPHYEQTQTGCPWGLHTVRSTPTPEFRNCIDENTGVIDLRLLPKIANQAMGQLASEMYHKMEKAKADGTMSPQEFESAVRNIRAVLHPDRMSRANLSPFVQANRECQALRVMFQAGHSMFHAESRHR